MKVMDYFRSQTGLFFLAFLLALGILIVDLNIPLGVAGGVPYVAVILIGWWIPDRKHIYYLAIFCSGMTLLGYIKSPQGGVHWMVLSNRFLALFAICVTAYLLNLARKRTDLSLSQAEEMVKSSEGKFRNLFEGSIQGIVIHLRHKPVFINRSFANIFGFNSPDEIYQLGTLESLIHPEELERISGYRESRMRGDPAPKFYVYRAVRKDGSTIWLDNIVTSVEWEGQTAIQSTVIDITERVRAEKERKESETRYRDLIEGSLQGFVILRDNKLLFINQALADIFGYDSPEELLNIGSFEELIAPQDKERVGKYHSDRVQGKDAPEHYEFQGVRKNGSLVWLDSMNRRIIWEGEPASQKTILDITKRKKALEQLNLLAEAIEQAGDIILITNPEGIIIYVNPGFERTTGFSKEEAIGKKPSILKSGLHNETFYKNLWETILQGKLWKARYKNKRKDGSIYEADTTISPIVNEKGKISYFIAVQKDVTYQTVLENRLRQSQRIEAIGTLAGGIAHDFNNLLMPIIGFAELGLQRHEPGSEDYDDLMEIQTAAYRGKDLVSQILLFSRKTESIKQPVLLQPIAKEVINLIQSTLPRTITIKENISDNLPAVYADSTQMNQVLLNLCVNASQAMPDGGTLTLTLENTQLENEEVILGEKISGNFVKIKVQDTGIGMDETTILKIFEPFFSTKEVGKGTGLGLSTVYGIVSQHGGHLRVTSEPNQGATFEIFMVPCEDDAIETESELSQVPAGYENILFVDDEVAIGEVSKRTLEKLGYKVTAMKESTKALDLFMEDPGKFDLLMTDQNMPGLTGLELINMARSVRHNIPVILCTGFSDSITNESVKKNRINEFVFKPLTTSELGRLVRRVLDNHRSDMEIESSEKIEPSYGRPDIESEKDSPKS